MSALEAGVRPAIHPDEAAALGRAGMPLINVTTRFVDLNPIPTSRLRHADSVSVPNVLANFGPGSVAGYDHDGRTFPINAVRTSTGYTQQFGTNGTSADLGHANAHPLFRT